MINGGLSSLSEKTAFVIYVQLSKITVTRKYITSQKKCNTQKNTLLEVLYVRLKVTVCLSKYQKVVGSRNAYFCFFNKRQLFNFAGLEDSGYSHIN